MGIILLKTLTEKSIIQDGKNKGFPVGELIIRRKVDLIYSYFHYANITFVPEILEKLRIKPEDIIKKPGKAPEKFEYYSKRNNFLAASTKVPKIITDQEESSKISKAIYKKRQKGIFKGKYKALIQRESIIFSKANMQRKNQGR